MNVRDSTERSQSEVPVSFGNGREGGKEKIEKRGRKEGFSLHA
jgi:hypothetical protein